MVRVCVLVERLPLLYFNLVAFYNNVFFCIIFGTLVIPLTSNLCSNALLCIFFLCVGIKEHTIDTANTGFKASTQEDKVKMSFSCQHGCISGTPFMFNWTHPAMPGDVSAYVANP